MAVKDWSTTAGSNTGIISGLTLDGAIMTPPQVDNAFRDFAAQIASQLGKMGYEGTSIASAGTTNLALATGWSVDITGTTTITAFGTVDAGQVFLLTFTGVLTLTHNATSLILPGGASFTTAAGDVAIMKSLGSGNWRCLSYQRAVTTSVTITPPTQQIFTVTGTWTKPTGCTRAEFEGCGGGGGSGGVNGNGTGTGVTAGAGSGFSGTTGILDVSAVVSAAVTIGAAGTAGTHLANGGTGGSTSITIGATTYTWGGGGGSDFINVSNSVGSTEGGVGGTGTNVKGMSQQGGIAVRGLNTDNNVTAGAGGGSFWGTGGQSRHSITASAAGGGLSGTGFGAGASGAFNNGPNSDQNGAAGTAGFMRVTEYYS